MSLTDALVSSCLHAKILHHVGDGGNASGSKRSKGRQGPGPAFEAQAWPRAGPAASKQSWSFQLLKHLFPVSSIDLSRQSGRTCEHASSFASCWTTLRGQETCLASRHDGNAAYLGALTCTDDTSSHNGHASNRNAE